MSAFLWTLLVLGIFEAGGSVGFLLAGTWPERTKTSIACTLVFWICFASWAAYLLLHGAQS